MPTESTEHLVAIHPFVPQRTKAIRRFLQSLAGWKAYQDQIYANNAALGYYNDIHLFYQRNRSNGFYPIPAQVHPGQNLPLSHHRPHPTPHLHQLPRLRDGITGATANVNSKRRSIPHPRSLDTGTTI